ncbi:hypothetical protein [Myxococcus sp. AS-1-15]|uniref:hypothetical protein n=1 Tax=Myxococcus sp. AS-1-15 TaxID=2874600 RepID=UPI001CBBAF4F|nr:hypothetical protein [Myxococcus sp. AS-1-15]MBZ4402447.1 hypothetical protein [Myxococcus sp. AS-1-15]
MKKLFSLVAVIAVAVFAPAALADTSDVSAAAFGPAAVVAPVDPAPGPSLSSIILAAAVQALPVVFTALGGLIAAALLALTKKLNAQAGESKLAAIFARATSLSEAVVRDIEVTLKPLLEAKVADGVLTKAELDELKAAALAKLKESLGANGLAELQQVLKLSAGSVGTFLSGLIEAALDRMKASKVSGPTFVDATSLGALGSAAALAPVVAAVPQTPRGAQ